MVLYILSILLILSKIWTWF